MCCYELLFLSSLLMLFRWVHMVVFVPLIQTFSSVNIIGQMGEPGAQKHCFVLRALCAAKV